MERKIFHCKKLNYIYKREYTYIYMMGIKRALVVGLARWKKHGNKGKQKLKRRQKQREKLERDEQREK